MTVVTGSDQVQVHDPGPILDIVDGGGEARAVIWPGTGARLRSMHRISLGPSGKTYELQHPSEAVYYVISGSGSVRDRDARHDLSQGSMFLIDAGTPYVIEADSKGAELVGGPCPPDPALYAGLAGSSDGRK